MCKLDGEPNEIAPEGQRMRMRPKRGTGTEASPRTGWYNLPLPATGSTQVDGKGEAVPETPATRSPSTPALTSADALLSKVASPAGPSPLPLKMESPDPLPLPVKVETTSPAMLPLKMESPEPSPLPADPLVAPSPFSSGAVLVAPQTGDLPAGSTSPFSTTSRYQRQMKRRPSIDKSAFIASVRAARMASRYVEEKQLGQGSFGTVHLVRDTRCPGVRRVVKKQQTRGRDPATVQLLRDEIAALARLDSPHIVRVFEFAMDEKGVLYIVEEHIRGREVLDLIASRGPLDEWLAQKILRQVLVALAYVHSHGILHRDVKPDNLMLTHVDAARADVKLIDFGLAASDPAPGQEKAILAFAGTPSYMAPEVLALATLDAEEGVQKRVQSLQALEYGDKVDVYSLGATLFEMLTEQKPYGNALALPGSQGERVLAFSEIVERAAGVPDMDRPRLQRDGCALLKNPETGRAYAQELVNLLLAKDPAARPSAHQALEHPWIQLQHEEDVQSPRSPGNGVAWTRSYPEAPYVVKVCLLLCATQLDASELEHLRHVFFRLDDNRDGYITQSDLAKALAQRVDPLGTADEVLKNADLYGDGRLCFSEFVAARLHAELLEGGHVSSRLAQRAFEVLDADGDGWVSRSDLLALLKRSSLPVKAAALDDMAAAFPSTQLDVDAFHAFLLERARGPGPARPPRKRGWFGCGSWTKSSLRGSIRRAPRKWGFRLPFQSPVRYQPTSLVEAPTPTSPPLK
jgi:serine/threonine protein kinase